MSSCNCQTGASHLTAAKVGTLERPRYSPGLILQDADLTAAVDYTRDLNRLLFRSLFGCGVICGYEVAFKEECGLQVLVSPGLALDGNGDPLHLTGQAVIELGKPDGVISDNSEPPDKPNIWVIACNRERMCAQRSVVCDSDELDSSNQPTRIRSGVEISISTEPPDCVCGCGIFANKQNKKALGLLAEKFRTDQHEDNEAKLADAMASCFEGHETDPACPQDCDCGGCGCGCCVLLAWGHWFAAEGDVKGGWKAMHFGVRRFLRPKLVPDPKRDFPKLGQQQAQSRMEKKTQEDLAVIVRKQAEANAAIAAAAGGEAAPAEMAALALRDVKAQLETFDPAMFLEPAPVEKPVVNEAAVKTATKPAARGAARTKTAKPS